MGMKRCCWLLLAGLLTACSSRRDSNEEAQKTDGGPAVTVADGIVPATGLDATALSTGADASGSSVPDTGTTGSGCPAYMPGSYAACTSEKAICDYSYVLSCPVGCSGGDYQSYQCSEGLWVDYRHSAGVPQCYCSALDFPKGMQGTWRFNQSGIPEQYAWIRFSVLGDTLSDAGMPGQGSIGILAGPNAPTGSIPWWFCNGQGRWFITQTPQSFEVRPPSSCASTSTSEIYTLTSRESEIPTSLPGCLLRITMDSTSGTHLEACKYPDAQCNAAMTTCQAQ